MAELDYAFLADYARVEDNGTLTTIGASWTVLTADDLPVSHRMAVAGRVRARIEEPSVQVRITLEAPDGLYKLSADSELAPREDSEPYGDGFVGLIFALDMQVHIPREGLYRITIDVDDQPARMLAFEVRAPERRA